MAVAQMVERHQVDDEDGVLSGQAELLRLRAEELHHQRIGEAGREPEDDGKGNQLHRVLAHLGGGRHHLGGMMHLVEFPHDFRAVEGKVRQPVAQIERQDLRQGCKGEDPPARRGIHRRRAEECGEPWRRQPHPEFRPDDEDRQHRSEQDRVDHVELVVEQRRAVQPDLPVEQEAEEGPQPHFLRPAPAPRNHHEAERKHHAGREDIKARGIAEIEEAGSRLQHQLGKIDESVHQGLPVGD